MRYICLRGVSYLKKVLFVATVVKTHIMAFHIPYLEWFKSNGYEVHVCAKNDFNIPEECIIPYCDKYFDLPFERSPQNFKNIKVYRQLRNIIDSEVYDIIHCHTPMGSVLTRIAAKNARIKGTKIIYTAHGFHFFSGAPLINWVIYYPIERWLSKDTDVLITINKEDYNRAKGSFKSTKIEYVPGVGVDTKRINNIKVEKTEKLNELNIPVNSHVILSVGELNVNKNHETIIKALAKLGMPNIIYIICGKGILEEYLKKLSCQLKLESQVKFIGYRNDVAEIIKVADIFVFPSLREGLSLSLMEAMAVGKPIICSDIRGNKDLIEPGKGGYLVKPNDVITYSKLIDKLILSPDIRESMSSYNKRKIESFDIETVKSLMIKIYKKCEDNDE